MWLVTACRSASYASRALYLNKPPAFRALAVHGRIHLSWGISEACISRARRGDSPDAGRVSRRVAANHGMHLGIDEEALQVGTLHSLSKSRKAARFIRGALHVPSWLIVLDGAMLWWTRPAGVQRKDFS
jgi:hypothetical protein